MVKTIIVLGGSYTGVSVAQKLLKKLSATVDFKIVLVNPADIFYLNTVIPRGILPNQFADGQIFYNITDPFKTFGDKFEFVQGKAEAVDPAKKTVTVSTGGESKTFAYDELVLATGSSTIGTNAPWKANGLTGAEIRQAVKDTQGLIVKAKSIAVGGAGVTGVELSAELGLEYGSTKEITLISSGTAVMEGAPLTLAQRQGAEAELKKLNVKVVNGTKITDTKVLPSGQTEITLSTGGTKVVDLYLPTVGMTPNSSYLPKDFLDARGEVVVDKFLHVKNQPNIWAAGDISNLERSSIIAVKGQADHLVKNLELVLKNGTPVAYEVPEKQIMAVTLGKSKGVGTLKGWKMPSWFVWMIKSRDMMVGRGAGWAAGTA